MSTARDKFYSELLPTMAEMRNAKIVMAYMIWAAEQDPDGLVFMTAKELSAATAVPPSSVYKAWRYLEDRGAVERLFTPRHRVGTHAGHPPSTYRITL